MIYNAKKVGHNGPEEATLSKQGFGQHIEIETVNGGYVSGGRCLQIWETTGKVVKDFCSNFLENPS